MTANKIFCFSFISCILLTLIWGCASMQTPQGGPKDTEPPKIVKMVPKNLSTNFKEKKIEIEFNEYFKLQNQFKEFSVSPEMEKPPLLKVKKKKLEITLQDTLEKNTTYTLNFGKSIADINEANELKNFSYVFATGPQLDSLSISGKVTNSLTGKPELDALVFILPLAKDSIFGKKRPSIFILTDSSGNYKLSNLRKDNYRLYTIKEQTGSDKIYQQINDEVGFYNDTIKLEKNIDSANLQLFKELPTQFRIMDKRLNNDGMLSLTWNRQLKKPEVEILEPKTYNSDKIIKFAKTNDTARIWLQKLDFDSLKIVIKDENKALDTIQINRSKKDTYKAEIKAGDNLEGQELNPSMPLKLYFNYPVNEVDMTKITLLEDSIPRKGFTITKDSTDLLAYNVQYNWKEKNNYILTLKANAISGIQGSKNKEINKQFILGSKNNYGTLVLDVALPDTAINYILQVVNEKKDLIISSQSIANSKKITFSNYKSGIYYVRVVYDENKNAIWDTGNVKEKRQPEKIWYAPNELSIRANWDRNEKLAVPKLTKTN